MTTLLRLSLGTALLGLLPSLVYAQQSASPPSIEDEIIATGSQVEIGGTYTGGEIGRSSRNGLLGNLDYLDAPFSTTSYTEELAREQQAISITDLIRNDPTVRAAKGFGNFQEVYILRGFPIFSDDTTYNGLYGVLPRQFVAAELVERVEVFRGANAFVNGASPGASGAGGAINIVPKRAGQDDLTRLTLGLRTGGESLAAADISRSFGANDEFGVRVNGVRRNGETAIEGQDRDLQVLSLGTHYDGDRARFSADIGYQNNQIENPRPQVTPSGAIPNVPDTDANYAILDTSTNEEQLFGAFRGEFDFTDSVMGWVAFGGRRGEEANVLANPTADELGNFTAFRFDNTREDRVLSGDIGVSAEFDTGEIGHRIVASGSLIDLESRNAFAFNFAAASGNIFDAVQPALPDVGTFLGGDLSDPLQTEDVRNLSLALADTISLFDDRLKATVGLRYQELRTESFDFNTGESTSGYNESAVTPAIGLVFQPTEQFSVFGNYAESLRPGQIAPSSVGATAITNAGDVLDPFRGSQLEAGLKYDGGNFGGTLSVFELDQNNAIVVDQIFTDDGEQRSRGAEIVLYGEVLPGLNIIGGATYLDAELSNTQDGFEAGNSPIGVPEFQGSLNVSYDVAAVPGLSVDGRVTYTDSQFTDTANLIAIDDWTRVDLGLAYTVENSQGQDIVLRARVENIADERYWASTGGFPGANYLVQGDPRTVLLSVAFGL